MTSGHFVTLWNFWWHGVFADFIFRKMDEIIFLKDVLMLKKDFLVQKSTIGIRKRLEIGE